MTDALLSSSRERYEAFKARNLSLDMTRGKPGPEQLDLSDAMLTLVNETNYKDDGTDCRNYGVLAGLPDARQFFAEYMGVQSNEVIVGGNASLNLMYDAVVRAMLHGVPGGSRPWSRDSVKFLCPSPGYDRHFNICQNMGIEMITVGMDDNGPDMDIVERLAGEDETVKGIWCVPRYSNPTGITYSDEVVDRLAAMKTRSSDFRIFWDNAYNEHHLTDDPQPLKNILTACREAGHAERVLMFGSTSKITFAGAGVSVIAADKVNIDDALGHLFNQTIGFDKLNQLRHLRFFGNVDGLRAHMRKHAAILKPKFDMVETVLTRELGGLDMATWTNPKGGYFVSLDTQTGLARKVVALADEAGVKLTGAGATFPYNKDPDNCNIRLAPSFPSLGDIELAMEVVCVCVKIAALEA
ncbi:MAG: aminotransferase class I/II-fold pyridoxal phosphate-dependent enzyme [Acidobacteriota bacterium]|nr:aminotransferase class I/II-fold pyridoxal phosphate-dependent enzyme [Acidobacteriota bacterium]